MAAHLAIWAHHIWRIASGICRHTYMWPGEDILRLLSRSGSIALKQFQLLSAFPETSSAINHHCRGAVVGKTNQNRETKIKPAVGQAKDNEAPNQFSPHLLQSHTHPHSGTCKDGASFPPKMHNENIKITK